MLIYRCEHPDDRQGPFNSVHVWSNPMLANELATHCLDTDKFPPFYGNGPDEAIGCETKQDLNYWFPPHLRHSLSNYGFKLVVFDVPQWNIREGHKQVAFKRDDKFKVAEYDLDTPVKDWYAKPATVGVVR